MNPSVVARANHVAILTPIRLDSVESSPGAPRYDEGGCRPTDQGREWLELVILLMSLPDRLGSRQAGYFTKRHEGGTAPREETKQPATGVRFWALQPR